MVSKLHAIRALLDQKDRWDIIDAKKFIEEVMDLGARDAEVARRARLQMDVMDKINEAQINEVGDGK